MTEEAKLVPGEDGGLAPAGDGWFVLDARAARRVEGELGAAVTEETSDGDEAYERFALRRTAYEDGWLPD